MCNSLCFPCAGVLTIMCSLPFLRKLLRTFTWLKCEQCCTFLSALFSTYSKGSSPDICFHCHEVYYNFNKVRHPRWHTVMTLTFAGVLEDGASHQFLETSLKTSHPWQTCKWLVPIKLWRQFLTKSCLLARYLYGYDTTTLPEDLYRHLTNLTKL